MSCLKSLTGHRLNREKVEKEKFCVIIDIAQLFYKKMSSARGDIVGHGGKGESMVAKQQQTFSSLALVPLSVTVRANYALR